LVRDERRVVGHTGWWNRDSGVILSVTCN
jgi:hypothetical protein